MAALQFYVGAFARVPGITQTTTRQGGRQCSASCGTQPLPTSKFCAECGAPITVAQVKEQKRVRLDFSDLPDKFVDQLSNPDYCRGEDELEAILLPNSRGLGIRVEGDGAESLMDVDQEEEVNEFIECYGEILRYLESTHGVTVTVDWGLVAFYY